MDSCLQRVGMQARTHLQIMEGPFLQLGIHWHQGFVISSSYSDPTSPGRRVHLPGLADCHRRPRASLQGVSVVTVVSLPFIPSQGHCGTGHALPWSRGGHSLLGPLHCQLLDGSVQALVAHWIPPATPAHQETAIAVQIVVRAPPACSPAAVTPAGFVARVAALAPLPGLVSSCGARLVARVLAPAVLTTAPVAPSPFAAIVPATSCAVVLPLGRRLQGMRLGKEALDRVDQVADA